jgi:hypothetical protein
MDNTEENFDKISPFMALFIIEINMVSHQQVECKNSLQVRLPLIPELANDCRKTFFSNLFHISPMQSDEERSQKPTKLT